LARNSIFAAPEMKKLFVIAPYQIDPNYAKKKDILTQVCIDLNIQIQIAEDSKTGNSLNAIETVKLIEACDFSIADLSYERPSCYYEIGYLQALNKRVYLISELNTKLHQVLNGESVLIYSDLGNYRKTIDRILENEL